jgi:osomolarity two-component system sensor histidine kinase NIK1
MYMAWRGTGFTRVNTTVLFLVALLATLQSHVAAYYLKKGLCNPTKRIPTIDSVADAVWFLVIVTLVSCVSCTVIAICIVITPLVDWHSFWRFWATWWLGVLTALITITPLITHSWAWMNQPPRQRPRRVGKWVECVVTALVTISVLTVIFFFNIRSFRPLPYLCFPLITFTAFRFNRVGWAVTVSAIALASALGSIRQRGAVYAMSGRPPVGSTTLILQIELFSIVMGVVSITLAAAVREKKKLTRTLHQMNIELENKVDRRTMELRKANEELQISQKKAEMASHAKSDFLANMSHEIRTPIHGILGLTALLLESELSVDQKESLVSVKECADLLLHIINSVLDLAKIEAGRLEVETVPFNIRKMVSSTFRMLHARAQERGLKLLWDVDRGVPHSLVGDVGKLQQCLLNLVGNALKFTHEGSVSVHVRVASDCLKQSMSSKMDGVGICSDSAPESMLIHFEVRDTGIGINQERLVDMFKPFTQADASTSRLYGGTGLGLCIVHRFVELLGGTIWVESEVGKGSTFHFCLPLFLNSTCKDPGSADASPRVRSPGKVAKSWSLMGGLVFSHTGVTAADSQPQSRKSSRVPSANNLSDITDTEESSVIVSIDVDSPRARRASASDYDSYKELQNHGQHQQHTRARMSQVSNWDYVRDSGDRCASNEVPAMEIISSTPDSSQYIPVELTTNTNLAPVRTCCGEVAVDRSPPSELSRGSSSELEKLLVNKLQLKILLAEDNAINQKVASRQLEKHGHSVSIVGDGQQALLAICARHDEFDLVLMDVQMPIMDGLVATEQIRKAEMENRWSRVPILGLTAHAIHGYQDTCLTHGMDGYLGKPFDIQQLLRTIGHILPGEKLNM